MSYTQAAALGVLVAALVDWYVLRTRLLRRPVFWATYPIVLFFQLLSNGIFTGRDIVRYDPEAIIGLRLAYAPVEDLVFGFALILLTLSTWVWLGRRGVQRTPAAGEGSPLLRRLHARRVRTGRVRTRRPRSGRVTPDSGGPTGGPTGAPPPPPP